MSRFDPAVVPDFERVDAALTVQGARLGSATIHEAAGRIGALPCAIKPVCPKFRVSGPAFTVQGPGGDNLWLHRALAAARAGDVLVAYVGGSFDWGYWGEIMSEAGKARGLAGLVIDACVRDGGLLSGIGFPVFARGLCIRGTGKNFRGQGALASPITLGDIIVSPGDLIVGDLDGLVAIPRAEAEDVIGASKAREVREVEITRRIREGETTLDIYDLHG